MTSIIRATVEHSSQILQIGKEAWLDAHGHSAPKEDIDQYLRKSYTEEAIKAELLDKNNIYHIIYYGNEAAGFSKIVLNKPNSNIAPQNVTLLDRIYLLNAFRGKNLGAKLFDFNVNLSKHNSQAGIWLAVWIENEKAIGFYAKLGFEKVGKYDFPISETHVNPNHIMFLRF
ncbi:GNAT family N-acetyltransferase [Arcticibacterium luteifluviistationis]|uniref:GNAT family N-acetyltransferase n=1 Tax=Arcticibacterium luteifluviistationis TaxID=1784714 RepID=A0A2Z4GCF5_9BACT|nr:GNAT family N-acetyltransferase [Arcticibacterium luteifluviistationis]AWV98824.1 GNAT family N-acetyltransferase [Arcticibacterium luteifluviistationis]